MPKTKVKNHYNADYHLYRHSRYIDNEKFFNFCCEVAGEKFWNFVKGKVLEVGCGIGQNISGRRGVVGIDLSEFAAKKAKKRIDSIIIMDAEFLGFKDVSFDSILCAHVIEHVNNPFAVIKEFNRILKENGKLALTIPLKRYKSTIEDQHLYIWGPMEISNLLKKCGFKILQIKTVSYRMKKILCYLPFPNKILLFLSRISGLLALLIGLKKGSQELLVYAVKISHEYS